MAIESKFQVFLVDRSGFGEFPIIVTAVFPEFENIIGEWFVVNPNADEKVRMGRMGWRQQGEVAILTAENFLSAAFAEAEEELAAFLFGKWGQGHTFSVAAREDTPNLFVTLALRNKNRDELRQILVRSGCETLKTVLSQCQRLPFLRRRDFD